MRSRGEPRAGKAVKTLLAMVHGMKDKGARAFAEPERISPRLLTVLIAALLLAAAMFVYRGVGGFGFVN